MADPEYRQEDLLSDGSPLPVGHGAGQEDFPTTPQGRDALEEVIKWVRLQILHYQDMERKLLTLRAASGKVSDDGVEEDTDARS